MNTCENCKVGTMREPLEKHPSYLQCDSCMAIQLTYQPQDYQEVMHMYSNGENKLDILAIFGGYGSGKSRATLTEFLMRALNSPNGTGLFSAQTLQQLKRTTLKTWFNEVCPPPLIVSYNKSEGEIRLINGYTIYTIPTDDEEKLRSINAGHVHLEEASGIKRSIYDQLITRMRDPFSKHRAIIVCSNPDVGWIRDVFVLNESRKNPDHPEHESYNQNIKTFIWETKLNKFLPDDFIEVNSKGKPTWWKKRYLEGNFDYSEGLVYPIISETFIDPYPVNPEKTDEFGIGKDWERIIGMDYGLRNPTAVVFGAINPKTGEVIIYDEYYVPEKTLPYHASQLKEKINKIPSGLLRYMVADPAIKNRMNDVINGKNIQSHFQEYGLFFQLGNNNLEYGLAKVNSYIEASKIKIYKTCLSLIRELLQYKYPELDMDNYHENQDEKPIKANDHASDAMRYMIARLPDDPEHLKSESYTPPKSYSGYDNYDTIDYDDEIHDKKDLDYMSYY
jgi:PBSX family phage terminase large subunit